MMNNWPLGDKAISSNSAARFVFSRPRSSRRPRARRAAAAGRGSPSVVHPRMVIRGWKSNRENRENF